MTWDRRWRDGFVRVLALHNDGASRAGALRLRTAAGCPGCGMQDAPPPCYLPLARERQRARGVIFF